MHTRMDIQMGKVSEKHIPAVRAGHSYSNQQFLTKKQINKTKIIDS